MIYRVVVQFINQGFWTGPKNTAAVFGGSWTHISALDLLVHNLRACGGEQGSSAPFIYRVFEQGLDKRDCNLALGSIRVDGLLLLIGRHASRVRGDDPGPRSLGGLEPGLVVLHAPRDRTHRQDLGEFGPVV